MGGGLGSGSGSEVARFGDAVLICFIRGMKGGGSEVPRFVIGGEAGEVWFEVRRLGDAVSVFLIRGREVLRF